MDSTRLYLARHGQVVNHHEYRYNGHSDVDITDAGVVQMERLAAFFSAEPIDAVYTSDLKRAYRGAEIIASAIGLKPVRLHALRELHLGRWEGLTREEAVEKYPEDRGFSFRKLSTDKVAGGESLVDLGKRVLPAVDELLGRHTGGSVLVVAHGGVNRVILSDAMGLPLDNFFKIEQDYGCLDVIDYFDDGIRVVKLLNGGPNQEMLATRLY
ncbi:MAG TPA: histidine phosphatase family protein [Thermodesulfobacteriota bacterium]|nr:histidine phosphatase family protein [Thermodesulfobacteriota bacterium]